MNNYFDYIIYSAFQTLLEYENKRELSITQLHNYREKLCQTHIEYHSQYEEYDDEEFEERLKYFHKANLEMDMSQESDEFIKFIKDNNDLFSYRDGFIYLKDNVTLEELEDSKFSLDCYTDKTDKLICGELISRQATIPLLDIIGANKIKNSVIELVKNEKNVEDTYKNYQSIESQLKINKLSNISDFKLSLIGNMSDTKMRCFGRTINSVGNLDSEKEGHDLWLASELIMEFDEYYKLNHDYIGHIFSNKFQRAIFDYGTLVYDRLMHGMTMMWTYRDPNSTLELEPIDEGAFFERMEKRNEELDSFVDEFEDEESIIEREYHDEDEEFDQIDLYLKEKNINMAFYLNYINLINNYQNKYGIDNKLGIAKNRLLYILDSYGDNLYQGDNFDKALADVSIDEFDYKDDFHEFYMMSRIFLTDLLEGWIDDEFNLRKLLFVSAYYDLTEDKRIRRIINKYKKTEKGKEISDIIFNHNYSNFNLNNDGEIKKLIKDKK